MAKTKKRPSASRANTTKSIKKSAKHVSAQKKIQQAKSQPQQAQNQENADNRTDTGTKLKISKSQILITSLIIFFALVLYIARNYIIVATVNGKPITRFEYYKELEKSAGSTTLDNLVTQKLIQQKLESSKIKVDEAEIDKDINNIKKQIKSQGQDFNTLLKAQGMTIDDLRKNIRIQKGVEKILDKKIKVTEKEVNDYVDANEAALQQFSSLKDKKNQARKLLKQKKFASVFQEWLDNVKKDATVKRFVGTEI